MIGSADVDALLHVGSRQAGRITEFGLVSELVIEIHTQDQGVHKARCQFLLNEAGESIHFGGPGRGDAQPADGQYLVKLVRCIEGGRQE